MADIYRRLDGFPGTISRGQILRLGKAAIRLALHDRARVAELESLLRTAVETRDYSRGALVSESKAGIGRRWRILAQNDEGGSVELYSPEYAEEEKARGRHVHSAPISTEFDELVIDNWLHLEQMDHGHWWMRLGDAYILVTAHEDGTATVNITRGEYAEQKGESTTARDRIVAALIEAARRVIKLGRVEYPKSAVEKWDKAVVEAEVLIKLLEK